MNDVETFGKLETGRDPYGRVIALTGLRGEMSDASGQWKVLVAADGSAAADQAARVAAQLARGTPAPELHLLHVLAFAGPDGEGRQLEEWELAGGRLAHAPNPPPSALPAGRPRARATGVRSERPSCRHAYPL